MRRSCLLSLLTNEPYKEPPRERYVSPYEDAAVRYHELSLGKYGNQALGILCAHVVYVDTGWSLGDVVAESKRLSEPRAQQMDAFHEFLEI